MENIMDCNCIEIDTTTATKEQIEKHNKLIISEAMRILGSSTSDRKAIQSKLNGSKPPKVGSRPRGRPRKII
jgi:vacuolar-type H+-ATPase subunit H